MSKIRLRAIIKKIITLCICLLIGLLVIGILNTILLKNTKNFIRDYMNVSIAIIVGGILSIIVVYIKFYMSNKLAREKTEIYEREIPKEIPPAIASILLDFFANEEQDYISTVASLISKGYIEIIENKEVLVKNKNLENLLEHEKLAFDIVTKKRHYNSDEFKEKVLRDAKKLNLIKRTNKHDMIMKHTCICVECFVVMFLILLLTKNIITEDAILGVIILEVIFGLILMRSLFLAYSYNSPGEDQSLKYIYKKTPKGKEYAIKVEGLRRFFKDYTLMDEKEIESIEIFGDYIPYAIALGEAGTIEKFVERDSSYRKMIYR